MLRIFAGKEHSQKKNKKEKEEKEKEDKETIVWLIKEKETNIEKGTTQAKSRS